MPKSEITRLLDDIQQLLKRDKRSVADLARDIGRDYHHVYDWVCRRRFNPGPSGLALLRQWLAEKRFSAESQELERWIAERNETVESAALHWFSRCKRAEHRLAEIARIAKLSV